MLHLQTSRDLYHVEHIRHIGPDTGPQVFQRAAHTGLGRQVHNDIGAEVIGNAIRGFVVLKHGFEGRETLVLHQHLMAAFRKRRVEITGQAAITMHPEPFSQQEWCEALSGICPAPGGFPAHLAGIC